MFSEVDQVPAFQQKQSRPIFFRQFMEEMVKLLLQFLQLKAQAIVFIWQLKHQDLH
jgi:hypothetical protein